MVAAGCKVAFINASGRGIRGSVVVFYGLSLALPASATHMSTCSPRRPTLPMGNSLDTTLIDPGYDTSMR